jgi:hypothetical protein
MAWLREHLLFVEELDLENGNLHMASEMTPLRERAKQLRRTARLGDDPFVVQRASGSHHAFDSNRLMSSRCGT